ncbi:ABC-2 family transporter protein [Paenibacillus sp. FSL K6-1217]|uniref:ABC transporter permease n=1 Tax=Paenibacillus sp. FSL K6-1217 TaxID=2921466 RepID=UPI0032564D14
MNNKFAVSFSLGIQNSMEYRFNFFMGFASLFFPIFIQLFLWKAVYSHASNMNLYGYTYHQMIVYTIVAALISRLVATGLEYDINYDIKSGGLNKYLVRPIGYFPYKICVYLGGKVLSFAVTLIMLLGVVLFMVYYFKAPISVSRLLVFGVVLLLAVVLNFMISFSVSAIAFWLNDVSYFFHVTALLIQIFSGGIFPLDIFGATWLAVFDYLPFKYTIYMPVNVINGKLTLLQALHVIELQLLWIGLLLVLTRYIWKVAIKKYIAVGG